MEVSVSNGETNQQKSQSQYQVFILEMKSLSHKVETSICKVLVSVSPLEHHNKSLTVQLGMGVGNVIVF